MTLTKSSELYLAYYQHWPMDTTIVGVFSTSLLAHEALGRSAAPPEGGSVVLIVRLDEDMEHDIDGG